MQKLLQSMKTITARAHLHELATYLDVFQVLGQRKLSEKQSQMMAYILILSTVRRRISKYNLSSYLSPISMRAV